MSRPLRVAATLIVSAAAVTYILVKIDLGKTVDILGSANVPWVLLSAALTLVTVPPMAWRWQMLLRARGLHERVPWLTRAYFISYAWGQILPTSVGGDATRIYMTARRHPGRATPVTGSVLLERSIGGAVTLALAGVGFVLAIGRYSIGAYLWPEAIFVVGTIAAGVVFFSRRIRRRLAFALPFVRRLRLEKPARAVYDGIHGYRDHVGTLLVVSAITAVLQLSRIAAIYASGRAVGIHLSLLPYIVLGPLLFLVMLVPFTVNGLGVREAFFVNFLGNLGVTADKAFACGFLFFVMTIVLAAPGLVFVLWDNLVVRRAAVPEHGA
ncbi:MAG TPA: lysylphosphatidylglycerol synthase transmembrane domain-containing protein [Gaiellaceae bacterium]|nr:lysylphosphatidylglycerol synthase transmembrane domain-containing protein [Gaiellaceae bacterium]